MNRLGGSVGALVRVWIRVRSKAMNAIKVLAWSVVLVMFGAIVYGFASGGFGDDGSAIWALPWGRVALIDLYLGLAVFAAWVAVRETSRLRIILWWVALVVLGNFAAGIYLVRALFGADDVRELLLGNSSTAPA